MSNTRQYPLSSGGSLNTPAPSSIPGGYFKSPCSIAENMALLTDAELRFTLVAMRRGSGQTVSDTTWQNWSGLGPRQKEYAIRGLREKGVLEINGRGERARYEFIFDHWESYRRHADRTVKPRTVGRSVEPKKGALVHPECRERGCRFLRERSGESGLVATPIAQPVAQTIAQPDAQVGCNARVTPIDSKKLTPLIAPPIAQPVARMTKEAWVKSLAILAAIMAWLDWPFLLRLLVLAVFPVFPDVTDDELAAAVTIAWERNKRKQRSEGLFFCTVPDAIRALRHQPKPREGPTAPVGLFDSWIGTLKRAASEYRARGAPLDSFAGQVDELVEQMAREETLDAFDRLYSAMAEIRKAVAEKCAASLTDDQRRNLRRPDAATNPKADAKESMVQIETMLSLPELTP